MLVYLIRLVGLFQYWVKQSCELENLVTYIDALQKKISILKAHLLDGLGRENNRICQFELRELE